MENPIAPLPAIQKASQENRGEWIKPAITDYDIQEATRSGALEPIAEWDGAFGYS